MHLCASASFYDSHALFVGISSKLFVKLPHVGNLKSPLVGVFTPRELANATNNFFPGKSVVKINQHITDYTDSSVHLFFLLLLLLFFSNFHRLCSLSNHASKGAVSSSALKLPTLQFSQQYWNLGQENIFLLILYCASHFQILLVPGSSKISHIKIS